MGHVDFGADLRRLGSVPPRRLTPAEYRSAALSHQFCLVAPGDWAATPKLPEHIVLAGVAGACVPVIVVASPVVLGAHQHLPFATTWLDHCSIAFLLPEGALLRAPQQTVAAMLRALANASPEQVESKRAALRRVYRSFVYGAHQHAAADGGGSSARVGAEDFVLRELCALARRARKPSEYDTATGPVAALSRCLLVPDVTDDQEASRVLPTRAPRERSRAPRSRRREADSGDFRVVRGQRS